MDDRPLTGPADRALAAATVVAGGRRHLATVELAPGAATIALGTGFAAAVDAIGDHVEAGRDVAVLASGDPGFFGIIRALRARGLSPEVCPAVSSVALAFARAGLPWDDAVLVSAHGRPLAPAVNVCAAAPKTAVLTGPGTGPDALGAALVGAAPDRRMFVAERLGGPDERTGWCTPAEAAARHDWLDPNVVIVLEPSAAGPDADGPAAAAPGPAWVFPSRRSPAGWALPEDAFDHRDAMITKAEVRALVLARLGPGPGDLVWDVGSGSGSVAVECARFGAAVVAVDHDADAIRRVGANAAAHGVAVRAVHGRAPAILATLPAPDAVFVGGGGPEVVAACAARGARVVVAALAALDRVRPTAELFAAAGYRPAGTQLAASRLATLPDGALRLAATNPITILWGHP